MDYAKVLIDSPQKDSSILYITGYECLDPVVVIDYCGFVTGFFPATEVGRARKESRCKEVVDLSEALERIHKEHKYCPIKAAVVLEWLRKNNLHSIQVPERFPLFEADYLRESGVEVFPVPEPFYPERVKKTEEEIARIRETSLKNVAAMREIKELLASASVDSDYDLHLRGEKLTSEFLQSFLLKSFLEKGLTADSVIVAVGDQGCDPHESGYGIVPAGKSIVVDIFPRSRTNHYFSDMTRTFCKHAASKELQELYDTVKVIQEKTVEQICAGTDAKLLHENVKSFFVAKGYSSGTINGLLCGFFHGTGHGVGLDCHEAPYLSQNGKRLEANQVVTVEPGLYYPGIGAVRLEDLIVVKEGGRENLTQFEKELMIE